MIGKIIHKVLMYALISAFLLAGMGWIWFNMAIGWAVLKGVFYFVFGG